MTEPNVVPGEPVREPAVSWPELPSRLPPATAPETRDPAVEALLERLGALASTPVSAHAEAYAAVHDELLEALNEDIAGQTAAAQCSPAPTNAEPSKRPGDPAQ